MTLRSMVLCASAGVLLAACAGQPARQGPVVPAPEARRIQSERAAVLERHGQWSLQGRVGLSKGRNGGSGRIDWRQDGDGFDVSLSTPITRQSWRLSGDPGSARLDGLDGGVREGADAETLLRGATGWVIPVSALSAWVRGIAAPDLPQGTMRFDPQGRLSQLEQGGWTIDYADWQPQPELGVALPHRLNATHGDAKVRLVIDAWQEGPPVP
jgi:outer membrane lipoprotein LolB